MTQREKEELWEKVMGEWEDSGGVEDLFAQGSECDRLWSEIYRCERCINRDLGVDSCRELEDIFGYYRRICMLISLRMFDYGVKYGQKM